MLAAKDAKADGNPEDPARDVVTRFEHALQEHDVVAIAALVADDVVVFENGHRNDGWQDFHDNPGGWKIVSLDWSIAKQK